jgi:hypothetical protein
MELILHGMVFPVLEFIVVLFITYAPFPIFIFVSLPYLGKYVITFLVISRIVFLEDKGNKTVNFIVLNPIITVLDALFSFRNKALNFMF